ncbi:MAG: toxin-antitoxin system YwqK family antitoxin [Winogradskyella sp.]|uniref:toxin-antitoxin system YwqK family antitoxin n=1 Tax=Winogradskyella sp. TaxID=1883156 RepID=UPI00385BDF80
MILSEKYSNKKYVLLFAACILFVLNLQGQQDTIYYNSDWKETIKDSAAFFRPPVKQEGNLYRIEDYYASGQLQMTGLSHTNDKPNWEGLVSWYLEDGKLLQQGEYKNNRLDGKFLTFLNKKKLIAIYKDGFFVDGAQNRNQRRNNYYTEIKNDTIVDIIYDKDLEGIRYENYRKVSGGRFLSKYYGENGELIGELKTLDNGYTKGEEVFYYYEPMRVMQIKYYPFERLLGETVYYSNGQLRTKFELEPELKKTFYTKNGEELGSVTYVINNEYLKPVNGTEYLFSYSYKPDERNLIRSVKTYQDGQLQKDELRHSDGSLKTITHYSDNKKELQISYDENGQEFARMVYKDYYPFTGTEIIGDKMAIYKEGELVKETAYYPKTKLVFSEKTQESETYFDKEGQILGTLEIDYQNKYAKPIAGQRFYVGYDSDIASIDTYENGYVKQRTVFRVKNMSETENVEFKRTEYFEDNSYTRAREVTYYSNGSKQSDIEYKGYDKKSGKFYNDKEELMGSYDYLKKEGTLYEFFSESNIIRLMQQEMNGNMTKLKRFDYGTYQRYGDVNAILVEEIDIACCSKYYKKNGDVFAEATYKDGKPWEGSVYDGITRMLFTIKDGKREGVYRKFDYNQETILEEGQYVNDKKEGIVKKHKYNGVLESTETYKNDKLNGKTAYYDKEGKQIATLIYKDNLPYDGIKTISAGYNKKPTQETYKDGNIIERVAYDDNGKRVSQYKDGKETQTIAYHKDSDKKRLTYTLGTYYINGEVIRYDENGIEQHKALFKNNKLESGIVYITSRDTYDKRVSYIILNKQKNKMSITMMGAEDNVVFFAEENLEQGFAVKYINKLNVYMDNITPESLY